MIEESDSQAVGHDRRVIDNALRLGVVFPLALQFLCVVYANASELRTDLILCGDESMMRFRVIEVAYDSLESVPCYTYLSKEDRSTAGAKAVTEQVAWARMTPGICEDSARKWRRTFEQQGYRCLLHKEDSSTVLARIDAKRTPPIVITMVGQEVRHDRPMQATQQAAVVQDLAAVPNSMQGRSNLNQQQMQTSEHRRRGLPSYLSEEELEAGGH